MQLERNGKSRTTDLRADDFVLCQGEWRQIAAVSAYHEGWLIAAETKTSLSPAGASPVNFHMLSSAVATVINDPAGLGVSLAL